MSLIDCISRFSTAAADGSPNGYTITRTAPGAYDADGLWVPGNVSTIILDAVVEPYGGQLEVVPEGVRLEDIRVIYMSIAPIDVPTPDIITIANDQFQMFNFDGPFSMRGTSTWRMFASRIAIP